MRARPWGRQAQLINQIAPLVTQPVAYLHQQIWARHPDTYLSIYLHICMHTISSRVEFIGSSVCLFSFFSRWWLLSRFMDLFISTHAWRNKWLVCRSMRIAAWIHILHVETSSWSVGPWEIAIVGGHLDRQRWRWHVMYPHRTAI